MTQEWCNELAQQICLPVGSEADTSQVSRFEAPAEETVGCSSDLEIAVRIHRRTVGELRRVYDTLALERLELVIAESG
jgi:hypothetical protein